MHLDYCSNITWSPLAALILTILIRATALPNPSSAERADNDDHHPSEMGLSDAESVTSSTSPAPHQWISVRLVRVEPDSVQLEWSSHPPSVRQQFVNCQARYGLLTPSKTFTQVANGVEREEPFYWRFEQTQVDVLDHFIPESPSFRLTNLLPNTSYVFAMMCHRFGGPDRPAALTITSDPIFFTTSLMGLDEAAKKTSSRLPAGNPSRYFSNGNESPAMVINDWDDHLEPIRWTTKLSYYRSQKTASYSIGLGIVCGLVGFLIINVTVVMAVRRYSNWHSRQSRIRQLRFIYGDSADHYYDVT